jgi:DNA invertase Pin-like site-specific DNA recombinase
VKIALYIRTSTDRQAGGAETQQRALRAWADAQQLDVTLLEVYEDFGYSGAKTTRPALDKMLADCRAGLIKTVACFSFSRFARSTRHLLSALEELNTLGVGFISISESIDTSTPVGKTLFTIIAAIGELERSLVQERVRAGLKNAAAKGRYPGRPKVRNSELIQELHSQGMRGSEIAKLVKVSEATVSRELNSTFHKPRAGSYGSFVLIAYSFVYESVSLG